MTFAFAVMHIGGAGYFSPPRVLTNPGRRVSADISSTLEPNNVLYLSDYQIIHSIFFVV